MSCSLPFKMKKNGITYKIPCGWCMQCRIDRANMWSDRLLFECQGKKNTFLTLTYNNENYKGTIEKQEIRKFLERFRIARKRAGDKSEWKHYLVGEYGGKFLRGHYHAIFTNTDVTKWTELIEREWNKGRIRTSPATAGRISYLLKYIEKELHKEQAEEMYTKNGMEKPFAMISKGIGKKWIEDNIEMLEANGGNYYYKGKFRPLNPWYKKLIGIKNFASIHEKIKEMEKNGYTDLEEYMKAINYLKEKHIITEMRNKHIPIDDRYLQCFLTRQDYQKIVEIAKKLDKIERVTDYRNMETPLITMILNQINKEKIENGKIILD